MSLPNPDHQYERDQIPSSNLAVLPEAMSALNPRGDQEARAAREQELATLRYKQREAGRAFLVCGTDEDGEFASGTRPPYGESWDRNYNPRPYPEAMPGSSTLSLEDYIDTGVGYVCGLYDSERFAWEIAGWNLVRTGSETRKRRK